MEIQDLNKKQMILLTLLITFVVSIATGIVTVSLVNQAPKIVPQTINNVIQRTIEKVTTVPASTTDTTNTSTSNNTGFLSAGDEVLIPIYPADTGSGAQAADDVTPSSSDIATTPLESQQASAANASTSTDTTPPNPQALGQGVIISDIGLVLVDSSILTDKDVYKVILGGTDFQANILKKFDNGFTILKISVSKDSTAPTPPVDKKQ